jgi:hypothetical protein
MAKRHPRWCCRVAAALSLGDDAALILGYEVEGRTQGHTEHALRLAMIWRFWPPQRGAPPCPKSRVF